VSRLRSISDVEIAKTWTYKGMMYSDIPNMAWTFGYIRTSWTMRSDLISEFVCRLLRHMDDKGVRQCTPRLRPEDTGMKARRFIDEEDFSPGYMERSMASFPRQGDREPWINSQDYYIEKDTLPGCELEDGVLIFDNPAREPAAGKPPKGNRGLWQTRRCGSQAGQTHQRC
jgi:hypothetical protein